MDDIQMGWMLPLKPIALLLAATSGLLGAGWDDVRRIAPDARVEVETRDRQTLKGVFVSATESAMAVRGKAGEVSIDRGQIRRVRVAAAGRRGRNGVIGVAAGAAIGLAVGFAVCPYCANEGNGGKFTAPLAAAGAGVGALAFLPLPYRTVYKN